MLPALILSLFLTIFLPYAAVAKDEQEPLSDHSTLEKRFDYERSAADNPFVIIPHKPNYLLPYTYNSHPNTEPFTATNSDLDNSEVKFQFSFKLPLARDIFHNNGELYFAYTNLSFWQAYNDDLSSPFRETNHEPELILAGRNDWNILGLTNMHNALGVVHQSNGQSGFKSRSWNRVYALITLTRGDFAMVLKPWWRIPEKDKTSPDDPDGDDNPDIHRYLGYGELYLFYKLKQHTFGVMIRNNLRSDDNRGAVQVDWSFPLTDKFKGYIQYFNGYGESLIDYNASSNRIGVGIVLTDWL